MFYRTVILTIVALTLSACNLSGTGEKGPFVANSNASLARINSQANPISSGSINTRITSKTGRYSFRSIRWNGWAELAVSGQYFNEFTANTSTDSIVLKAITKKNRTFDVANVHIYSHLAAARIKQLVSNGETLSNAWKATQLEMKQLFGLVQVSADINKGVEQLRLSNGSGRFRIDNANLLLFTGSFLAAGGDANALDLLTSDFADDGQINGASLSFYNSVASIGATDGLIGDLSNNLRNYGVRNPPNSGDLPRLPIWVNQNPVDTVAPVITVTGDNPVTIYVGATYNDAGATAVDDVDGTVTAVATNNSDEIDTSVAATHTVTYSATDVSGNTSTATRTVNVVNAPDTVAPVITVTGNNPVTIYVGTTYNDAGATAVDDVDGAVTAVATNNSDEIDTSVVATHTVTYSATDVSGNTSTATRTVNVVNAPDTVAPVLTLLGTTPFTVEAGEAYDDAGATASDNVDGDITSSIIMTGNVNILVPNTYTLTYNVKDAANNYADPVQRIVTVQDTIAPVLILRGSSNIVIQQGATYVDEGAIATDSFEGDISQAITVDNPVDTSTPATYTVTYNVSDNAEHAAETIIRTVRVNAPPTANAGADVSVLSGETVTLTGAGSDADGTVSYKWKNGNTVLATSVTYAFTATNTETLTFEVEDNDGAVSTDTVVVTVTTNQAPVVENQYKQVDQDTQNNLIELVATDPDGDTIIFTHGQPDHGTITGAGSSLQYTPDAGFTGRDRFTFTASDEVTSSSAQVLITVNKVIQNTAPVAIPQDITVDKNSVDNSILLHGKDVDGDALSYAITVNPLHGTFTIDGANVLYTPEYNYTGVDSFKFTVNDGKATSVAVSVDITVRPVVVNAPHIVFSQDPLYVPIGSNVAQLWDKIHHNSFAVSASGNLTEEYMLYFDHTITSENLSAVGTYNILIELYDMYEMLVAEKVLTIEVVPTDSSLLNISPVIGQLSEQNIILNQPVTIGDNSPSVISDQDGNIVSYEWTENNVVISNALTFDYTATTISTHLLTLKVTDNKGAIALATKKVNVVFSSACHATATTEATYVDSFIVNNRADTPWPSNFNNVSLTVADIASAFNAARPNGEYQIGQTFVMPTQSVWDGYSDSEKALYLINAERCARGIRPYEGISETVVADTAQYYASYLASNNVFGHYEDGRSPWERLNQLSGVVVNGTTGNADFFSRAENLASNSIGSTGTFPTVYEPVAKAVYAWMYNDKEATKINDAEPPTVHYTYTYGHRKFILAKGLVENFGEPNKEGLIGIATATVQETVNGFNWTKVYTVMNGFDPNENWVPNTPIKKVDYIAPTECVDLFYESKIRINTNGVSYLACIPQT